MRYIQPLQPANTVKQSPNVVPYKKVPTQNFQDVLNQHNSLKLSKHASQRLAQRNIKINEVEWQKITSKILEAKEKGVQEPLVVTPKTTMIVSAKNMTVITAMSREESENQLFTNIDGTIILS